MVDFSKTLLDAGILTAAFVIGAVAIILSIVGPTQAYIQLTPRRAVILGCFGGLLMLFAIVGWFVGTSQPTPVPTPTVVALEPTSTSPPAVTSISTATDTPTSMPTATEVPPSPTPTVVALEPTPASSPTGTATSMPTDTPTPEPPETEVPPTPTPTRCPNWPLCDVFEQVEDGIIYPFNEPQTEEWVRYSYNAECSRDGSMGLRITYDFEGGQNVEGDLFGGLMINLTGAEDRFFDASEFTVLTSWVRGDAGGETYQVKLKDDQGNEGVIKSAASKEGKIAVFALSAFMHEGKPVNKDAILLVTFGFERDFGSGSICVDEIRFE